MLCVAIVTITFDNSFSQSMIVTFGIMTAYLTSVKNKWCVITGLISQPFWIYSTYIHLEQNWGMFILTIYYTITWIVAIPNWWLKKGTYEKA